MSTRIQRGRACVPCHLRKRKCDGRQPSCTSCARSQIRCEYPPPPPVTESPPGHRVKALQSRVEELEAQLGELSKPVVYSPSSATSSPSASSLVDPDSGEVVGRPTMIANRRQYNLFLDVSTLRSPPRPLLHAMNLVAAHVLSLSASAETRPTLHELEELKAVLLGRVHNGVSVSLEGARDLLAGAVCAPALAAQYLVQTGRFREAHWLASSAVRFAVSCGLHAMNGYQGSPISVPDSPLLVAASSEREYFDRRMSWWLAFAADAQVEAATGLCSALRPEIQSCLGLGDLSEFEVSKRITTAFPVAEQAYEGGSPGSSYPSMNVIQLFAGGQHIQPQDPSSQSVFAMKLKSLALFQAAALVNDHSRTQGLQDASPTRNVEMSISVFISTLPDLTYHEPSDAYTNQLNVDVVVAYMLAHAAVIYLLGPEATLEARARHRSFDAAIAMGRLAAVISEDVQIHGAAVMRRCCLEALQVLTANGGGQPQPAAEFQSLQILLDRLRLGA